MTSFTPRLEEGDRLGILLVIVWIWLLLVERKNCGVAKCVHKSEYRNSPTKRACVVPDAKATSGKPCSLNWWTRLYCAMPTFSQLTKQVKVTGKSLFSSFNIAAAAACYHLWNDLVNLHGLIFLTFVLHELTVNFIMWEVVWFSCSFVLSGDCCGEF